MARQGRMARMLHEGHIASPEASAEYAITTRALAVLAVIECVGPEKLEAWADQLCGGAACLENYKEVEDFFHQLASLRTRLP